MTTDFHLEVESQSLTTRCLPTGVVVFFITYVPNSKSCLKKNEWEIEPEGYRDPANAEKERLVKPRVENALERGALGGAV